MEAGRPGHSNWPRVQYEFVTWEQTFWWTVHVGRETRYSLVEWGKRAHEGIARFGDDVIDGF